MKLNFLLLLLLGLPIIIPNSDAQSPVITDYQYEYFWDTTNNSWGMTGKWSDPNRMQYIYDGSGTLTEILVYNKETEENVRRTLYVYNMTANQKEEINQKWENSTWTNTRRDIYTYNDSNLVEELIIQFWISGSWVNSSRRHSYSYNEKGQILQFSQQSWKNNGWTDYSVEKRSYIDFRLSEQLTLAPDGSFLNRYTFIYNDVERTSEFFFQIWSRNQWLNRTHRITYRNYCGFVSVQILQQWVNEEWLNDKKVEYFFTYNPILKKIPVCHSGNTIYISQNAVPAHLKHGDCIGECLGEKSSKSQLNEKQELKNNTHSIVVYPNPSTDKITVKIEKQDCTISRIEIADMRGNVRRIIETGGEKEVIINRENLKKGSYLLKVYSDNVYSVVVIFN